ncbi:MAG: hypothetical protein JXR97_13565 [Planctomycetes bacterium]|nr:hypothetical protein [Planctomycetota bacterium]
MKILSRHVSVALFLCLLYAGQAAASDSAYPYRFAYPPMAAIKIPSRAILKECGKIPYVEMASQYVGDGDISEGLKPFGGFAKFDASVIAAGFDKIGARNISVFILPPNTPPINALAACSLDMDVSGAKLMEIFSPNETKSKWAAAGIIAGLNVYELMTDGMPSACMAAGSGRFILATGKPVVNEYLTGTGRDKYGRDAQWRPELEKFLAGNDSSIGLWLNARRVLNIAQSFAPLEIKSGLLDFEEQLKDRGLSFPVSLSLQLSPYMPDRSLAIDIPFGEGPGEFLVKSTAKAVNPADAFPENADFVSYFSRDALLKIPEIGDGGASTPAQSETGIRDALGGGGLWDNLIEATRVIHKDTGENYYLLMDALRLLTGVHPGNDMLDCFGRRVAFGMWKKDGAPRPAWAAVVEVGDAEKLRDSLVRSLAWKKYFARKSGALLDDADMGMPSALFARQIVCEKDGLRFAAYLDSKFMILSRERETVELMLKRLATLTPREVDPYWIAWSVNPSPEVGAILSNAAFDAFASGKGRKDILKRMLVTSVLQQLSLPEKATLSLDGNTLRLKFVGEDAPFTAAVLYGGAADLFSDNGEDAHRTANASAAMRYLRMFLSAQGLYRTLGLGAYNGAPAKSYAPNFSALVGGKGEGGAPLSEFFNRQFFFDPAIFEFTFTDLMRYLDRGDSYGYYRFYNLTGKDAGSVKSGLVLAAFPNYPARDPILAITGDGKMLWRMVSRKALSLPFDELIKTALSGVGESGSGWAEW